MQIADVVEKRGNVGVGVDEGDVDGSGGAAKASGVEGVGAAPKVNVLLGRVVVVAG